MATWLLAVGFLSILAQVVLLRELQVAFYGSELVYLLALGIWMLCTALGAAGGRRGSHPSMVRVRWMLMGLAPLLVGDVALVRGAHRLLGGVRGADLPFPQQMLSMIGALLLIGVPLGLLFRWVASRFVGDGATIARAYALECAGGMAGGLAGTLALAAGLQNLATAILCGLLALVAAVLPRPRSSPRRGRTLVTTAAVLFVAAVALWMLSGRVDVALTRWNHPALIAVRDTPYGRIAVTGSAGQVVVFENGALAFESQGTAAEEFVHLAALQHPRPRTALVLGGGVEGLARELDQHALARVDQVELDRTGLELALRALPPESAARSSRAAVALHFDDPRRWVERSNASALWDLVLVGMPEPGSGQTNRFYSREFFARCAAGLTPDGVLALRLRSAENLWTPLLLQRAASVYHALRAVFPEVVVVPGATNTFLASRAALVQDADSLVARMQERGVRGRLVTPAYLRYLYTNDRFAELTPLLEAIEAPPNEDSRPICYQYTLLLWFAKFHPEIARALAGSMARFGDGWVTTSWLPLLLVPLLFGIVRRRDKVRRCWMTAVAGFAGMVTEGIVLLDWQTRNGVLYQDLGVLLTLFMGGTAVGALGLERWRSGARAPGALAWIAFVALELAILALLRAGVLGMWLPGAAALLVCGALVGALFAVASQGSRSDPRPIIGSLYAADLAGGCAGALAASLFLLPVLGLAPAASVLAFVAASALLLV